MNDKVYIITQGEYSDYHIVAVFNIKEDAEKFVNYMSDKYHGDPYEIEEYDIGIPYDYINNHIYSVKMCSDNSANVIIKEIAPGSYYYGDSLRCKNDAKVFETEEYNYATHKNTVYYYTYIFTANDKDHAKKIAFDRFAKYKAEKLEL